MHLIGLCRDYKGISKQGVMLYLYNKTGFYVASIKV